MSYYKNIFILLLLLSVTKPGIVSAKFGSKTRPETKKDAVKITTRGAILLNKKIAKKYFKDYGYVNINYSYVDDILTIKPILKATKDSTYLHRTRKGKVVVVLKKNYLKNAGMGVEKRKYFQGIWDTNLRAVIIDCSVPSIREDLE